MADPSRTEEATPKRVSKARGDGNVPRSQEVGKALSILAGYIALTMWVGFMGEEIQGLFRMFLVIPENLEFTDLRVTGLMTFLAMELAKLMLPILLFILACIFLGTRLQVGSLWISKPFQPKLSKFNPLKGIKRMFLSVQTFIRMGRSLAMAFFIGLAPFIVVKAELPAMLRLFDFDPTGIIVYILTISAKAVKYALVPMLIIAIADLWYTRWKYNEDLKMTKSEVKDERKQAEGDMEIKAKMRQKMMAMVMRQMMTNVPKADVVITNPIHLAVALKYDTSEAPAPVVVAKGANRVAERIKELAKENRVPIRENVPLARALYKQTEVGDMIPAELYQAVAVILAQIWKNNPSKQRPRSQ